MTRGFLATVLAVSACSPLWGQAIRSRAAQRARGSAAAASAAALAGPLRLAPRFDGARALPAGGGVAGIPMPTLAAPAVGRAVPAGAPADPGFHKLWTSVVDRVLSRVEGRLEVTDGQRYQLRVYAILRPSGDAARSITVWELETFSRGPGLPDAFQRKVLVARAGPAGRASWEADERGVYAGPDPAGFSAEVEWWKSALRSRPSGH